MQKVSFQGQRAARRRAARRSRVSTCMGWLALVWLGLVGCARDPGELEPAEALTAFLTAVERSTHSPEQQQRAYAWIDLESQQVLRQRAELTESLAGHALAPWELLVPGRVSFAGQAVGAVPMRERIEGDRAVVEIPIQNRADVEVPMVRQDGRWRVVLGLGPSPKVGR